MICIVLTCEVCLNMCLIWNLKIIHVVIYVCASKFYLQNNFICWNNRKRGWGGHKHYSHTTRAKLTSLFNPFMAYWLLDAPPKLAIVITHSPILSVCPLDDAYCLLYHAMAHNYGPWHGTRNLETRNHCTLISYLSKVAWQLFPFLPSLHSLSLILTNICIPCSMIYFV